MAVSPERIIEKIEDFIDLYVPSDIKRRGMKIYKSDDILSAVFDKQAGTGLFNIKGSSGKTYFVEVEGLNTSITTRCSCPYNWGPVCKHVVAALRYIQNEYGEIPAQKKESATKSTAKKTVPRKIHIPKRNSNSPFEIKNYEFITDDLINDLTFNIKNEFYGDIKNINFKPDKLKFVCRDYYIDLYVDFWFEGNKLYTKCDCDQRVVSICKHQEQILRNIAGSPNPDIFEFIKSDRLKKIEESILDDYGIKEKNFNKYFTIVYQNYTLLQILKPEYRFLLPLNKEQRKPFEDFFKTSLDRLDKEFVKLERITIKVEEKNKRDIGFLLNAIPSGDQPVNDKFNLYIIAGKKNKSGDSFTSHIKFVDDITSAEYTVLNKNRKIIAEKITSFYTFFNGGVKGDPELRALNIQKKNFQLLKELKPYLAKEIFVYASSNRFGEWEKLKKSLITQVKFSEIVPELEFEVYNDQTFIYLRPKLLINGTQLNPEEYKADLSHILYSVFGDTVYLHKSLRQSLAITQFHWTPVIMVKSELKTFLENYVLPISKYFPVKYKTGLFKIEEKTIAPLKRQVFLSDYDDTVLFKPVVLYENGLSFEPGNEGTLLQEENDNRFISVIRNREYEKDFLQFISGLHPDFEEQIDQGLFYIPVEELLDDMWFFDAYEAMEKEGIEIFGVKELKSFKYSPYKAKINSSIKSGQDWFEVEVDIAFGNTGVDLKSVRKSVLRNEKYIRLKDGSIGILPEEWMEKLKRYFRAGEIDDGKVKISKLKFNVIEELFGKIDDLKIQRELAEKKKRLQNLNKLTTVRKPREITATLRNYQKEGLNWLVMLNEMGWGGILADDMGLGKTLQILSLLQKTVRKSKKPNLIVVPTTLLFNWEMEIKKFAPKLTYHFYYGNNRDKEIIYFKKYNIIFTSYGIMVKDIEFLKDFKFNYVILDESQAIKNPGSLRYKAAFLLQANHKLTLTGTPIENSTFDLYAQMNFVNPGFFGSIDHFKENYSNPIDKEGNAEISNELGKLTAPFILRRTKEQVAKDLPEKTENILFCEMGTQQRSVYDAFRNKYRNMLLGKIQEQGLGKSKLYVLEGLTKLRQICDSPALLPENEDYGNESVKIEELLRHISEKTSNHKILVFSQFVKMLKLIKSELKKHNIPFEYLDGQSNKKQREESVNRFQEIPGIRVFLISLKAGGTGLNLTAADYVYIVDPWWNPAVENQAIDRTHRIGQGKKVFAYRMICKNTVEEKILNLQAKKKKIAADIITADESIIKKLSLNDIKELFG